MELQSGEKIIFEKIMNEFWWLGKKQEGKRQEKGKKQYGTKKGEESHMFHLYSSLNLMLFFRREIIDVSSPLRSKRGQRHHPKSTE